MRQFEIPEYYRSNIISKIKKLRKEDDRFKKDFSPTEIDFGPLRFFAARHFGFCFGVENAIEIVYKIINDNHGKRIFLLSEMIHNPMVNNDLKDQGVNFIMDTKGNQYVPWDKVYEDDIVIIPAFGISVEIEAILKSKGIETHKYNTTCPFVEKVWKRSESLGKDNYTVVIHGKPDHEETRATFSHSKEHVASIIIRNLEEAKLLGHLILNDAGQDKLNQHFKGRFSSGFDAKIHLRKIGVVNQTTMLATDTKEISDYLNGVMEEKYGEENIKSHIADTKDTLCYATYDNQRAVSGLLKQKADLAIVVGGYNSSNTSHLVELCEQKLPTYFISGPEKITENKIEHFNYHKNKVLNTLDFLPKKDKVDILITSGASCPDSTVDAVLVKLLSQFEGVKDIGGVMEILQVDFRV